ncbi:FtsX-like permease family protein [Permianibacter sp. IMCC34836]|nr:FtsX-like permease family protein [Permianibacter fluminis]
MARLALTSLRREWRSSEIRVLLLALAIGIGSVSTTGFLSDRLDRAITERGGDFLGADAQLSSPNPIEPELLNPGSLQHSSGLEFASMLAKGDAFQLASVRAIDSHYPLRGKVVIAPDVADPGQVQKAQPNAGEIYVDGQLLPLLNVAVGDRVEVGAAEFRIAGIIKDEPGRAGAVFGLAPRVFMRFDEVAKTEIVQPGSRVTWLYYYAGEPEAIAAFVNDSKPKLTSSQRLIGGREGSEAVSGAFARTSKFGALGGLVSLLMATLAVALAARRYALRHFDQAALMRCFGLASVELRNFYALQLLLLGLLGSALGLLIGYVGHWVLLQSFAPDLAEQLPPVSLAPVIAGFGSGLLALSGAALPSLLRLAQVPPLRVLRRELTPLTRGAWSLVLLSCLLLLVLCWWYAGSVKMVAIFVGALSVFALLLWGISLLALQSGQLLRRLSPGALRFGIAQLLRHRYAASVQLGAFALALLLMGSVALVRTDLIDSWQQQLPVDAPNHFLVNITPEQQPAVNAFLTERKLSVSRSYAMVRGRLTSKAGKPIEEMVPDGAREDNSLRRELNLTWSEELPANNTVTDGVWFRSAVSASAPEISIEDKLAKRLGVQLGDALTFHIADRDITATVTSLREVKWDSMQPNFFVIFSPGALESFPASYVSAMFVPATDLTTLPAFVHAFPTVTVISLDRVIREVQQVIAQVVVAVELLLSFLLLSGVAVLIAALLASLDERRREAVVLRTLGASRAFLQRSLLAEFLLLGLLAGLLAAGGTEGVAALINDQVFDLSARFHPWLWWVSPLIGMVIVASAGTLATRRIQQVSPAIALRETA